MRAKVQNTEPEMLRTAAAAARFNLSKSTLLRMARRGEIALIRMTNRTTLVRLSELRAALEARRVVGAAAAVDADQHDRLARARARKAELAAVRRAQAGAAA